MTGPPLSAIDGATFVAFVTLLGACVWLGGFVAIAVVARVARSQLERPAQVAFFRALGRRYLGVGVGALVLALAGGAALLAGHGWDAAALLAVVFAGAIVLATAAGVVQARGMTRLRARAVRAPDDAALAQQVRRGAVRARVLRAAIGAFSVGLLFVAAVLAT
jgi:hypothetical protein